jgi:preprotein translocase subunit Sec63
MNTDLLFHLLIIGLLILALLVELRLIAGLANDLREKYNSDFYKQECKREDEQSNRKIQKTLRKFNEFFVCAISTFSERIQQIRLITCKMGIKFLIRKLREFFSFCLEFTHKTVKRIFTPKPPKSKGK